MIEYSTCFWLVVGFSFFSGLMGYYVGERGWAGVEHDISNIKLDINHIRGKIDGSGTSDGDTPAAGTAGVRTITRPTIVSGPVTAPTDNIFSAR